MTQEKLDGLLKEFLQRKTDVHHLLLTISSPQEYPDITVKDISIDYVLPEDPNPKNRIHYTRLLIKMTPKPDETGTLELEAKIYTDTFWPEKKLLVYVQQPFVYCTFSLTFCEEESGKETINSHPFNVLFCTRNISNPNKMVSDCRIDTAHRGPNTTTIDHILIENEVIALGKESYINLFLMTLDSNSKEYPIYLCNFPKYKTVKNNIYLATNPSFGTNTTTNVYSPSLYPRVEIVDPTYIEELEFNLRRNEGNPLGRLYISPNYKNLNIDKLILKGDTILLNPTYLTGISINVILLYTTIDFLEANKDSAHLKGLFQSLSFQFQHDQLNNLLNEETKNATDPKQVIRQYIAIYEYLLQNPYLAHQRDNIHQYIAYFKAKQEGGMRQCIFWLTKDYFEIKKPLLLGSSIFFLTLLFSKIFVDTVPFWSALSLITILGKINIDTLDNPPLLILIYRWVCFALSIFLFLGVNIIRWIIELSIGFCVFAVGAAMKKKWGMGNSKDIPMSPS